MKYFFANIKFLVSKYTLFCKKGMWNPFPKKVLANIQKLRFLAFFRPSNLKTENVFLRVGHVYKEESFSATFNMSYGINKVLHYLWLWVGKIAQM